MEEFPSNSQRRLRTEVESGGVKKERVERIVTSKVTQRKKPLGRRFSETFFGGDAKGTLLYVAADILVPAAKDMVADAFTQGFERFIFGETRSVGRRPHRPAGTAGYVAYNRMGANRGISREREGRDLSARARATHQFDEIILDTRIEAEQVLERLDELIHQYDEATVADLYNLIGVSTTHTDGKWGWDDLHDARVIRQRSGGYLLQLPDTKPVD